MCGIVGYITTESKLGELDRSRFLRQALIVDTLRGDDSTGVFSVPFEPSKDDGTAFWIKQVGPGSALVDCKEYWENFADVSPWRCAVGHNRAATIGGVSNDTAHPFQVGPITLVHNGTLTSTFPLPLSLTKLRDKDVEVDSHAIAYNLAHHSVDEVIPKLNGAFALVWHDARDDSINIVRNNKRPLHFGLGEANRTLYFMSEGEMLAMLDSRLKLGIKNIYYPNEGQYLKWLPDTPLDRPITRTLEMYEDSYGNYGNYWRAGNGYNSRWGIDSFDEDDDDPFGAVYAPKAGAHEAIENHILVGGRRKEVPMILQEALLGFDVVTEDRWVFTPTEFGMNPQDTNRMYCLGDIQGLGRGILYTISPTTANQTGTGKAWTVRCIGVKVDTKGEPWFIVRLVSTFVNPLLVNNGKKDIPVVRTTRTEKGANDPSATVPANRSLVKSELPGPGGVYIPTSEWYHQTAGGCVLCHKTVSVIDAYDIVWVTDGPICPNCDEQVYFDDEV